MLPELARGLLTGSPGLEVSAVAQTLAHALDTHAPMGQQTVVLTCTMAVFGGAPVVLQEVWVRHSSLWPIETAYSLPVA